MPVLSEDLRQAIENYTHRYATRQAALLPALHLIQDRFRCVPAAAIEELADLLDLHPAQVYDTLSFYGFFRDAEHPLGKFRVWVCRSLPCMLRGGEDLLDGLCRYLHVEPGQTTPDGSFTLEYAECLGACELAPCLLVNDECHGPLTLEAARQLLDQLRQQGGQHGI
ncbi:MAG: NAD(P)H-dependent oxidoreductase subunit E [Gemmatales bacterium]|nr:NAD(P)H-dependent oxidoreductase subunit E [Gemmatales bacterium]MCS7161058.1 NAD(P)H-dependent oxidoreductase subunit E [Gemmatales bacterium]MDW8176261.1 NAD(P)H-dependent oxidoreductase subunit E [Gemmatales bacterium]MDW8223117.1 NAD(P)H-dependent oxidoreductase subunit E [Gemmatales bacterium]